MGDDALGDGDLVVRDFEVFHIFLQKVVDVFLGQVVGEEDVVGEFVDRFVGEVG